MTTMKSPMSFLVGMTVAFVLLMSSSWVFAQPIIQANGLFVVGKEKTIACYVNSAETPTGFPLTWSRDGVGLTASREQVVAVTSNVNSYNSYYRFNVTASDNLSVFRCTATFPSGATSATWNVYVYKGPDTPIITGPSSVVSGVSNTWQCLVDGASSSAPNVEWQFGNNSKLDSDTFTSSTQVYTDRDQLEIFKETSILTLTVTAGAPSFTLICRASHFDSGTEKSANVSVTVLYGEASSDQPDVSPGDDASATIVLVGIVLSIVIVNSVITICLFVYVMAKARKQTRVVPVFPDRRGLNGHPAVDSRHELIRTAHNGAWMSLPPVPGPEQVGDPHMPQKKKKKRRRREHSGPDNASSSSSTGQLGTALSGGQGSQPAEELTIDGP